MPEKLRFKQLVAERGAVHGTKDPVTTRAAMMERSGDQFLAGSGFALDQDRIGICGLLHDCDAEIANLSTSADEAAGQF